MTRTLIQPAMRNWPHRLLRAAIVFAWITIALGCGESRPPLTAYHRIDLPANSDAPTLSAETHAQLLEQLRSGDIILCARDDPVSVVQRLTTIEPTYFLHSGTIEVVEKSNRGRTIREAVVWHSTGAFDFLKLSPHMLGKVKGDVRSTPLEAFIRNYDALMIIRLPDADLNARMAAVCRRLHESNVKFDPYFDCVDHRELCCTEFTAVVIEEAGYDYDIQPAPRTSNAAMASLMIGWNVTVPGMIMAGQFERLPGAATIALISRYGRLETYLAFRDASMLVQERVLAGRAEARDFAALDGKHLGHFPPRMQLFMRGVEGLALASPTLDAVEIRRRNEIVYEATLAGDAPRSAASMDQ